MIPGITMVDSPAPDWLTARCMRMLDKANAREQDALTLAEHPACTEAARTDLRFSDSLRADVAAVAAEWRAESPSDA
jgi:hypothetical protein